VKRLIEQLKNDEGFRSKPYFCTSNKLTIGYGRNLEDKGITKKEAEYLLKNDIKDAQLDCELIFPNFDCYSRARRYALINMMYNLGLSKFLSFKKMIRAIKEENWEKAAGEVLDSKYAKQVGGRAERISKLMSSGKLEA